LIAFSTYKHWIGAVLLALYTFVATPVQLWHHHAIAHVAQQISITEKSQQDILIQDHGAQQEANCPVCSHKYAAYTDVAIVAFESVIDIAGAKNGLYQLPAVTALSFPLPNKGPPAVSL
jgi:hypothetical protein